MNDWSSAKASHTVLVCHIEQGEIKDYTWTEQIGRVRHVHAQRHTSIGQDTVKNASKRSYNKSMVCQYYKSGTCSQQITHETKGLCMDMCVLFVSQRLVKNSNILRSIVETSKIQKASKHITDELMANKDTACHGSIVVKLLLTGVMVGRTCRFSLKNHNIKAFLTHFIQQEYLHCRDSAKE